jgi:hypothetical protein
MKYLLYIGAITLFACNKGEKYTCKGVKDGNVISEQKRFNAAELAQYNLTPIYWRMDTNGNVLYIYPECK